MPAPSPARVPGWERVLNAFMAAPDRTLTNVQLADVPGVQAFHQRIQDARRYGYIVTDGVLVKKGRYAYTLVGVSGSPMDTVRPLSGATAPPSSLPVLAGEAIDVALREAVEAIEHNAEALTARFAVAPRPATPARPVEQSRMVRDSVAVLASVLGDEIAEWDEASMKDLLALAARARDEIETLRTLRTLIAFHAEAWKRVRASLAESGEIVQDVAELSLQDLVNAAVAQCKRPLPVSGFARRRAPTGARKATGPDLMRKALEHCEQPMHSAKIAEWVMSNGGDAVYKGLTPAATMAAQLATSNKTSGEFVKVAPGCYGLREWTDKADEFGNALLKLDPIR